MNHAAYSLLTLRPDPERIDVLYVGAVALDAAGTWHVSAPGTPEKLRALGAAPEALGRLSANLHSALADCASLNGARCLLVQLRSALALHEFEGAFSYASETDFAVQMRAILSESVIPKVQSGEQAMTAKARVVRPRTRARLRKQFESMGIMARTADEIGDHKVVHNYPVSARHGLKAEFALKNTVMHITETVDFEVADEAIRTKTFEAQAKCLVLRAARDAFGSNTQCHIVVSGSGADHASRSVDLLSTMGRLYAVENPEDMTEYLERIARAAGSARQIVRATPG